MRYENESEGKNVGIKYSENMDQSLCVNGIYNLQKINTF